MEYSIKSGVMKIKGKKVVDAKTPLTIQILPSDIRAAKTKQPDQCAAAVALKRQCEGALSAHVHLSRTYVEYPDKVVKYVTPTALRTEIISFDRGHTFQDGTYSLQRINPSQTKEGVRRKNARNANRGRRPTRKYAKAHHVVGVRANAPHKATWAKE